MYVLPQLPLPHKWMIIASVHVPYEGIEAEAVHVILQGICQQVDT